MSQYCTSLSPIIGILKAVLTIVQWAIPIILIFLGTFIYFYPIYSGKPVSIEYVKKTEWLNSWEYDGLAH